MYEGIKFPCVGFGAGDNFARICKNITNENTCPVCDKLYYFFLKYLLYYIATCFCTHLCVGARRGQRS